MTARAAGHAIQARHVLLHDRILIGEIDEDGFPIGAQIAIEVVDAYPVAVSTELPPTVVVKYDADGNKTGCHVFEDPATPVFLLREPGAWREAA